jgi:hypothetical protein
MTVAPTPRRRVTPREIADLLAQARSLSVARPAADPAALAAYRTAKTELLAAITEPEHQAEHRSHRTQEQR